jgi:hypothetical protein
MQMIWSACSQNISTFGKFNRISVILRCIGADTFLQTRSNLCYHHRWLGDGTMEDRGIRTISSDFRRGTGSLPWPNFFNFGL